ncbi:DUF6446 family protein [Pseudoruegeria sp. SK021]|uniref:DUF6446 family protein n=1 Tax=Pseudoruegeria sp. SK021 TaxID=1933035 RepID=UPI000A21CA0E|nr:DUF6446 family protein [Pseudoruegeria sp. SK021]OSP56676.1 histidine kinase [Pseudoruegeria sp. SK021]
MNGKILGSIILGAALIAGGALYYFQVYYFYDRLDPATVSIGLVPIAGDASEAIPTTELQAINATSSPIRFRACFATPVSLAALTETYQTYPAAEPLTAPGWFDCFNATEIGTALEDGSAVAFLGQDGIGDGVDRVIAVFPDGRAFAWHQLNETFTD